MRLTQKDITLKELFQLSISEYKKKNVDNKKVRAKIDVIGGKLILRKNLEYNPSTKRFEQTGREVRMDFIVRTIPKSYIKNDTIKVHKYPVTILFKDFFKGFNSPVKLRTGSFKKPLFPTKKITDGGRLTGVKDPKERDKILKKQESIRSQNLRITNQNIKNGVQMEFFFDLMYVYKKYGILFGPDTTNHKPPKITNPKLIPFLDKHSYYIVSRILPKVFNDPRISKWLKDYDSNTAG